MLSAVHTPAFAEADDVGLAVRRQIGQQARVLLHPPALLETEVGEHELRVGEECRRRFC